MKPDTIKNCLTELKNSGSVFGVILSKENSVIYSDVPFTEDRVANLATVLDDIQFYFKKEERLVDQIAFGFDGANLLIVSDDNYRVVVFHSLANEIDLIAKAAKSFLLDFQVGLFASEFEKVANQDAALQAVSPKPEQISPEQARQQAANRPATQRIMLKAEAGFDDTQPIQPNPDRVVHSAPGTRNLGNVGS